jgi:hypothetical protein
MTMLPISPAELTAMQVTEESALPDTCTIQTQTVANTKGSVATTYANTYTGVACRLMTSNRAAAEKEIGMALAAISDYVFTVGKDQALSATDRVVCNGVTYEVTACVNAAASWRMVKRAYLKRVE